jgi:hypothetical protein
MIVQSQVYLSLRNTKRLLNRRTETWDRLRRDMADMLTWIAVGLAVVPLQELSLEGTWMMLCVSRLGKSFARSWHPRSICVLFLFQCGERGHYANHCRNRNVPGNRGGVERSRRHEEQ